MTKADLLAGLAGKPTPFEVDGFAVHLRRLTSADRVRLMAWYAENKDKPGAGIEMEHKLCALAIVNEKGEQLLAIDAEAAQLPTTAVDAISTEVARRNGLDGEGKASPQTPN